MTIYNRPDEQVFASGAKPGEVVAFPDVLRGWGLTFEQTEGKPPMEWMNSAFLRLNEAIRYFMQRGLPEWSATEDYPARAFVQHGGVAYTALQANSEVEPGTAAVTWAPIAPSASTTAKGLIEIATAAEAKALASALLAITPSTLGAVLAESGYLPGATFAEIAALTEDDGPIICTDMAGALYVWTTSAYFTGYRNPRCGLWYGGAWDTPEPWELPARGGVWLESDPKHKRVIARYREQGRTKTVGEWLPKWNFIADLGGGEWKAPDLRDVFQRMDGTDADTANPAGVGVYKQDALQNITGSISPTGNLGFILSGSGAATGAFKLGATKTGHLQGSLTTAGFDVALDASLVARASSETTPVHTRVAPVILI